jgi:CDP-paratose 2-epimerase
LDTRYYPKDSFIEQNGISEQQPLNFHSPYGSSKGGAEQYVLDYARSYNLQAVVFRMSCIYGPHQFGTEDQGWIAHFLIQAIKGKPIFIYGDGLQVRDILYVEDLLNAFQLAWKNISGISGHAFNIGGGVGNSLSLLELIRMIEMKIDDSISLEFDSFRTGDQVYYVSDNRKFRQMVGWSPKISKEKGLQLIFDWLREHHNENKENEDLPKAELHEVSTRNSGYSSKTN